MYECLHVRRGKPGVTILDTLNGVLFKLCRTCLSHHIITNRKSWKSHRHKIIKVEKRENFEQSRPSNWQEMFTK